MKRHPTRTIVRNIALGAVFTALGLTTAAARTPPGDEVPKKPTITVYKDPSCGCCKTWIQHLVRNGYRVEAKDTPDMTEIKRTLGVPAGLTACHTAIVNGYLIEGHVPAADIDRLLARKPRIAGLAVPGMPMGSPGMEGPQAQAYRVLAFEKTGKTTVFASH